VSWGKFVSRISYFVCRQGEIQPQISQITQKDIDADCAEGKSKIKNQKAKLQIKIQKL
jgi:hypothetical protein